MKWLNYTDEMLRVGIFGQLLSQLHEILFVVIVNVRLNDVSINGVIQSLLDYPPARVDQSHRRSIATVKKYACI